MTENAEFLGITLVDIQGNVLASNRPFSNVNLADRKHVREAMRQKMFSAGEYIVTRVGKQQPSFSYAYPILDQENKVLAVLTAVLELDVFTGHFQHANLPEKSFVSVTDYQGLRLFYYPSQQTTNPIGQPIRQTAWDFARNAEKSDVFITHGSDGVRRIFSFEQIRLRPEGAVYLYLWAGLPEAYVLRPANMGLMRNGVLMLAATVGALILSHLIARNSLIVPVSALVQTTRDFSQGRYEKRSDVAQRKDEIGVLASSFNGMAQALEEKDHALNEKIEALEAALEEIQTLRGILPICSYCKNIRNDDGYYEQIEQYIHKHSGVSFSHTICPSCIKKHYPQVSAKLGISTPGEEEPFDAR